MRQQNIGRRGVLAGAGSVLASPAIVRAQGQSNGVALVIGNSKYKWEASLPNVQRDAPDVAKRFQSLGLSTELLQNADRETMRQAIEKFAAAARNAPFAALYFAGHGANWENKSYLVPVDADLGDPSTVRSLVSAASVRESLKGVANRMLVFDNCRNNPADGWRQREAQSLASPAGNRDVGTDAASNANLLMLYSTASGHVALDGPAGANSPFAAAFLRQLDSEAIDIQALPGKLRRDLLIATQGRQILFDVNTYAQPFLLRGARNSRGPANALGTSASILELNGAYDFAREANLTLPAGLVALYPTDGSPHRAKIGSYKSTIKTHDQLFPALVVVMSVEGGTGQIIFSSASYSGVDQKFGRSWRFVQGPLTERGLSFVTWGPKYIFDFKSANSGSFVLNDGVHMSAPAPTTRLDG